MQGGEALAAPLLEVGCGHGGGLARLHDLGCEDVTGFDFTPSNIDYCEAHWDGPAFSVDDAVSFCRDHTSQCFSWRFLLTFAPLPQGAHFGRYQTILNIESSHCYSSFQAFLDNCHRALVADGQLRLCDFRTRADYEDLLTMLRTQAAKWELLPVEDITRQVRATVAQFWFMFDPGHASQLQLRSAIRAVSPQAELVPATPDCLA
jgi:2-polyprenyl-3-methyl-5-hydroxy-6-metoxy-1,4-benzoquinol methylase